MKQKNLEQCVNGCFVYLTSNSSKKADPIFLITKKLHFLHFFKVSNFSNPPNSIARGQESAENTSILNDLIHIKSLLISHLWL